VPAGVGRGSEGRFAPVGNGAQLDTWSQRRDPGPDALPHRIEEIALASIRGEGPQRESGRNRRGSRPASRRRRCATAHPRPAAASCTRQSPPPLPMARGCAPARPRTERRRTGRPRGRRPLPPGRRRPLPRSRREPPPTLPPPWRAPRARPEARSSDRSAGLLIVRSPQLSSSASTSSIPSPRRCASRRAHRAARASPPSKPARFRFPSPRPLPPASTRSATASTGSADTTTASATGCGSWRLPSSTTAVTGPSVSTTAAAWPAARHRQSRPDPPGDPAARSGTNGWGV
jgi:hypothetical protein